MLTGSARQALGCLLGTLMQGSKRRRVLISSFNCQVVSKTVERAGLEVETFDFAAANGRIDWDSVAQMLTQQHLALVVSHFFGIPTDFRPVMSAARSKNVVVIEDCAHSLGGSISDTHAGQLGDAAVFSFNYDKPISLAGGGALLVNERAIKIDKNVLGETPARRLELRQFRQLMSALQYRRKFKKRRPLMLRIGSMLHPLPKLPDGIGMLRAAVGVWQLNRYDSIRAKRDRNAQILNRSVGHLSWHVDKSVRPAYLKMRIIVHPSDASTAVTRCRQQGIAVANSNWPKIINPLENECRHPHAHSAAMYGLEIPVHQNLLSSHITEIAAAFSGAKSMAQSRYVDD